jgi:hypothetical protein
MEIPLLILTSFGIAIAPSESLEERDFHCQEKLLEWELVQFVVTRVSAFLLNFHITASSLACLNSCSAGGQISFQLGQFGGGGDRSLAVPAHPPKIEPR